MSLMKFFVENVEAEIPKFEAVFQALPADKLDWRPHEKSRSAIELVRSMAHETQIYPLFLKTGQADMAEVDPLQTKSVAECSKILKSMMQQATALAGKMTEQEWNSPSKFLVSGHVAWETTRGMMAWGLLLDLIHHRGQLSVYIRPMGGKVPAIYGPSGDAQG